MAGSSDAWMDDVRSREELVAELRRLRAELDRHRVAGDRVAGALRAYLADLIPHRRRLAEMRAADEAWRSVRSDAPAVGGDTE